MLTAIDFDNQIFFTANEIVDITADRSLPYEFEPTESSPTQGMPKLHLGIAEIPAQFSQDNLLRPHFYFAAFPIRCSFNTA
jgi:hypothetical protein